MSVLPVPVAVRLWKKSPSLKFLSNSLELRSLTSLHIDFILRLPIHNKRNAKFLSSYRLKRIHFLEPRYKWRARGGHHVLYRMAFGCRRRSYPIAWLHAGKAIPVYCNSSSGNRMAAVCGQPHPSMHCAAARYTRAGWSRGGGSTKASSRSRELIVIR